MSVQIRVTAKEGKVHILAISILEDLWRDYEFFKEQARIDGEDAREFAQRRNLRAALFALVAYAEGLVNEWCRVRGKGKSFIERTCFGKKCDFLCSEAIGDGFEVARDLRHDFIHLKPCNDFKLFGALSRDGVEEAERQFTHWRDAVAKSLNLQVHPNTKTIVRTIVEAGNLELKWESESDI